VPSSRELVDTCIRKLVLDLLETARDLGFGERAEAASIDELTFRIGH
jgi:hypothetical protein